VLYTDNITMPIPLRAEIPEVTQAVKEAENDVLETSYPAKTKQASAVVAGIQTEVMCLTFADKILVTITQEGKLGQWVSLFRFCSCEVIVFKAMR
jgi:hypothetical protein